MRPGFRVIYHLTSSCGLFAIVDRFGLIYWQDLEITFREHSVKDFNGVGHFGGELGTDTR